jgi:hypothetical protein
MARVADNWPRRVHAERVLGQTWGPSFRPKARARRPVVRRRSTAGGDPTSWIANCSPGKNRVARAASLLRIPPAPSRRYWLTGQPASTTPAVLALLSTLSNLPVPETSGMTFRGYLNRGSEESSTAGLKSRRLAGLGLPTACHQNFAPGVGRVPAAAHGGRIGF